MELLERLLAEVSGWELAECRPTDDLRKNRDDRWLNLLLRKSMSP